MNRIGRLLAAPLTVLALLSAGAAVGDDQPLAFVRGLQEKGYADVAVEYLKAIQQSGKIPEQIADVFDLEMSRSLRGAANFAYDPKEAEQMAVEAQKHLDKFLKEKPDHPDATSAMVSWGTFAMDHGLQLLRVAQGTADKAQQAKRFAEARASLEEARPRFQKAVDKFQARLAELPAPAKRPTSRTAKTELNRRAQLELDWLNARFQIGMVDYYVAQTFADPKDPARQETLKKAAAVFDEIYQTNRVDAQGQVSKVGLSAHMWHGKAAEEWGDTQLAEDIYDEVLSNAETGVSQAQTGMEPLFAQVAYFRLLIHKRKVPPAVFVTDARDWLRQYGNFVKTDGYQGIALEAAKTLLEVAEQAGPEKRKLTSNAKELLMAMQKFPSGFQKEAILTLRKLTKAGSSDLSEVATFDEALALANSAAESQQWADAVAGYSRAIEIAQTVKVGIPKAARVAEARDVLTKCQYMCARDLLNKDKFDECLTLAGKIIRESKESPVAPDASELAVKASFALYLGAAADKREAARERVAKIAKYTIDNWPAKPQADGARILLGQLSVAMGKIDEALATFESVNPKSERYAAALHYAGHTYWVRYLLAKQGQPKATKEMAADREKAFKLVTDSLALQRKALDKGKAMPQQMIETQLELADIYLERSEAKEAVAFYEPLVAIVKAAKPQNLDLVTMRIFVGSVKAYIAVNDVAKASDVGMELADLGSDVPQVNAPLVDFARLIDGERRRAEQTAAKPSADPKEIDAAKAKIPPLRDVLGKLMKKLASREQHSPAHMLYIAETCGAVDLNTEARQEYQKFLDRLQSDKEFAEKGGKHATRARTQLIGLLRKEGNPEEAMKQVEELIKAHPNVLEPLKEKGLILQAWAEKDPAMADKAIEHWTGLRNQLKTSTKPAVKAQYYEVVYRLAESLVNQAARLPDKKAAAEKAKQGEQLLKSTLTLSPTLGGRGSLVGDYGVLLDKAIVLQGRTPDAKKPSEAPKPAEPPKTTEPPRPAESPKPAPEKK